MKTILSCCLVTLLAAALPAQQAGQPGAPPAPAFMNKIYGPEFIMSHQGDLALSDDQKQVLRKEIVNAQGSAADLQWRLAEQAEKLGKLFDQPVIDENAVMAQLQEINKWEFGVKQVQLRMLVRIRNALTPKQRATLDSLRVAGVTREN